MRAGVHGIARRGRASPYTLGRLKVTGHAAVNDDGDGGLSGAARGAVACLAINALAPVAAFGRCGAREFARAHGFVGAPNAERAPTHGAGDIALLGAIG